MNIGYACITVGPVAGKYKTCRKSNATSEYLTTLIKHNLNVLEEMIDYNHQEGVKLFRMSSDIIPFGSDFETNTLDWSALFRKEFEQIAKKIKEYEMRVSMHPGQYTVLNSPDKGVIERAVNDLSYHSQFMENLHLDYSHKLILHVGGVYGDKQAAIERFIKTYNQLDDSIKGRLIIENDDRLYTIDDVLKISQMTGAPVVYDNLHHQINPPEDIESDYDCIKKAKETWAEKDGRPKVHYAEQQLDARVGSHSQSVSIDAFLDFYHSISPLDVDIMLEVKDKNLSAKKCMLATMSDTGISQLEEEWERYKYAVLERSPSSYNQIIELLKDKDSYPVVSFYRLIEEAIDSPLEKEAAVNALDLIWGYLKEDVTAKEKNKYVSLKEKSEDKLTELVKAKRFVHKLSDKYNKEILLKSLYFYL